MNDAIVVCVTLEVLALHETLDALAQVGRFARKLELRKELREQVRQRQQGGMPTATGISTGIMSMVALMTSTAGPSPPSAR